MKWVAGVALWLAVLGTAIFPCRAGSHPDGVVRSQDAAPAAEATSRRWSAIGSEVEAHKFPYPFYFSRVLDVDQSKMPMQDQRSIRFDFYKSQTVLEITGNYYAAYSADRMDAYARLKETFQQVVMPILQASVPHFPDDSAFTAYAIEVSHHVRQKEMGLSAEHPENVTVIIPVLSAQKLVDAKTDDQKQAASSRSPGVSERPALFHSGCRRVLRRRNGRKATLRGRRTTKQPAETAAVTAQPAASSSPVRLRQPDEDHAVSHADLSRRKTWPSCSARTTTPSAA